MALKFKTISVAGYEKIIEAIDESVGLHALIAIHDSTLGPALGGVRVYPYTTFDEALTDVLRLSKGMTYKSAMAETGTSGGKSVIILDHRKPKDPALLKSFAEAVNSLSGHYICAEDVGMSVNDLSIVRQGTRYTVGLPHPKSSGDPCRFTAWGGFRGIQAACKFLWGTDSVKDRTIAIQGVGGVGSKLAEYLFWQGAKLIFCDIDQERAEAQARLYGAKVVSCEEILSVECDILAPCAMGGILNSKTIPGLRCKAVAGLANNQLLTDADGYALMERGILYTPDYVINSGGLINVSFELEKEGYCPQKSLAKINQLYYQIGEIFAVAKKEHKPTHVVANELAEDKLKKGVGKRIQDVTFHH